MKVQIVKLVGSRRLETMDVELSPLHDDEILVRVVACGVCTSELPAYRGETQSGVPGVSFRYAQYPGSLGHEVVGVIEDLGPLARNFKRGDRVTGVAYRDSGFASHVVESEVYWAKVPSGFPLEHVLGEPIMAATNIVRTANPDFEDFVVVIGAGFLSLVAVSMLSKYPLRSLVVTGRRANRLQQAKDYGATHTIDATKSDAYWEIRRLVDGDAHDPAATPWRNGVDVVFEFAGNADALRLGASICKPKQRAKLVLPSFYGQEPFPLGHYLMNRAPSLVVCHPAHSSNVMADLRRGLVALQKGHLRISELITHSFSLDQVGAALEMAQARGDDYIKGIVVPDPKMLESKKNYRGV